MIFSEKYVSESNKDKPENKDKKVITNEAYAVGEILQEIKDILGVKK